MYKLFELVGKSLLKPLNNKLSEMQSFSVIVLACFVAVMAAPEGEPPKKLSDKAVSVVKGNNLAGFEIYKVLSTKPGNIVYSPISAQSVLALAYIGAREDTADELSKTLHFSTNQPEVSQGFGEVLPILNKEVDGLTINVVNKLYPSTTVKMNSQYLKDIETFKSSSENLDYSDNVGSANKINGYINEKTKGKIDNVISSDDLNSDTKLVLVNTVYFKAKWEEQFSSEADYKMKFQLGNGETKEVPQIFREDYFGYLESPELDAKILELKYKDNNYAMYVVLPNKVDGLKKVEDSLTTALNVEQELPTHYVNVALPKFKIETKTDLKEVLQGLGVNKAFNDGANFNGLLEGSSPVKVDKVTQKAFISVDEEGTEAAAATVLIGVNYLLHNDQKFFEAKRPFLYYIKEKSSNTVLFVGRVQNPGL